MTLTPSKAAVGGFDHRRPWLGLSDGVIRLDRPRVTDVSPLIGAMDGPVRASFRVPSVDELLRDFATPVWTARARAGDIRLVIRPANGPEAVGRISLFRIPGREGGSGDLWIAPAHRRQGIAPRAMALRSELAFDRLGLPWMEVETHHANAASARVLQRLGWTLDRSEVIYAPTVVHVWRLTAEGWRAQERKRR